MVVTYSGILSYLFDGRAVDTATAAADESDIIIIASKYHLYVNNVRIIHDKIEAV